MALKRKITDKAWDAIEVGRAVTLHSRDEQFGPRLDHSGSPCAEWPVMNGTVIHKRRDYLVLVDVDSLVVRRDEIHKAVPSF